MITQNDIIATLIEDDNYIKSNLRLQKTLFIIFGQLIKTENHVDVSSFKFQRWMYGPVNVDLYRNWNGLGDNLSKLKDLYPISDNITTEEKKVIIHYKKVLDKFSVYKLIDYTHKFDSWKNKKDFQDMDINEVIKDFKKKITSE